MKILIYDRRTVFLGDIETRSIIDEKYETLDISGFFETTENAASQIDKESPDMIVVADNLIQTYENFGKQNFKKIVTYNTGAFDTLEMPFLSYGQIRTAAQLLDAVLTGFPKQKNANKREEPDAEVRIEQAKEPEVSIPHSRSFTASPPYNAFKDLDAFEDEEPEPVKAQARDIPRTESRPPVERALEPPARRQPEKPKNQSNVLRSQLKPNTEDTETGLIERKKAKVITTYAAKGGVGKTTISTELAVYLSLTNGGRGRYRVCIVDYNIDFGDVLTTLDMDPDPKKSMTYWAADIRDRMENGEHPDTIRYTRSEIEEYLQIMSSTGLYALLSPIQHADSMDIGGDELSVMLRNIIEEAGFDYVVVDTGNNTRDAAIIALLAADYILMIATQDVTTANCNDSFIATMHQANFNMDKVRLVMNLVRPTRDTGVSCKDVEDMFRFPCLGRIPYDPKVLVANNTAKPFVYNAKFSGTKEIQKIAAYVIKGPAVAEQPKSGLKILLDKLGGKP